MRSLLIGLLLAFAPLAAEAQQPDLALAAEQARRAWFEHDARALVAESPRLLVQLPGADPSVALGPDQAAALLADFMVQGQEVETVVRAAREVESGRGYVELQRRYRVAGTQDVRLQSLLLGYRLGREGWRLVELRVVGRVGSGASRGAKAGGVRVIDFAAVELRPRGIARPAPVGIGPPLPPPARAG